MFHKDAQTRKTKFAGQRIELTLENGANDWRYEFGYWGSIEVVSD